MARYRNGGSEPIVFRDDAPGKHRVKPGGSFDVVGDQHIPYVTSLPGVRDATVPELAKSAEVAGIEVNSRTPKAELVQALDAAPADDGTPG